MIFHEPAPAIRCVTCRRLFAGTVADVVAGYRNHQCAPLAALFEPATPVHERGGEAMTATYTQLEERILAALGDAYNYGQIDGAHHKAWVIDQMVRALTGDGYDEWIDAYRYGADGSDTHSWDEGVKK